MLRRSRSREPLHKGAVKFTMGSDDAAFSLKRKANKWAQADAAGSGRPGEDIPACWRRAAWRSGFRRRLLGWFARNKRDLPWRRTKDPYAVWLSEIMLQQTQAPTVVRYFERFLTVFPTLEALAQAQQAEVLRLWEGLGYYRRAVQLHEAARKIVRDFGGHFPQTPEELLQLPGIGRYTAGAILSIAFDQRHPILEANTTRLWARLLAYPEPTGTAAAQRLFWQMAEWILPRRQVGQFNQALMELGSTVCLPRRPRCADCPVSRFCLAYQQGLQETIPRQRAKPAVELCHEAAVIVRRNDRVLLRRIPEGQRWAGLWDFPRFPLSAELAERAAAAYAEPLWAGGDKKCPSCKNAPLPCPSPPGQRGMGALGGTEMGPKSRRRRKSGTGLDRSVHFIAPTMAEFLIHQMEQTAGIAIRPIRRLKTIRYAVTRYRVQMECYEAESLGETHRREAQADRFHQSDLHPKKGHWGPSADGRNRPEESLEGFQWVRLEALEEYPMSSPARKLAQLAQATVGDSSKQRAP